MNNLLHQELSYKLRGLFFAIRNGYGPGQKESIYSKVLAELLQSNNLSFEKEKAINVRTPGGEIAGAYRPDFLVSDKIIVELKSSNITTKIDEKQLYYYLRNSKYEVGFLVNFSTPKLYIKRIIYTNDRKPFLPA